MTIFQGATGWNSNNFIGFKHVVHTIHGVFAKFASKRGACAWQGRQRSVAAAGRGQPADRRHIIAIEQLDRNKTLVSSVYHILLIY